MLKINNQKFVNNLILFLYCLIFVFLVNTKIVDSLPTITSDSLWLSFLNYFGFFNFSTPTSINLFPEYFLLKIISYFTEDFLSQIIFIGMLQFILLIFFIIFFLPILLSSIVIIFLTYFFFTLQITASYHSTLFILFVTFLRLPHVYRPYLLIFLGLSDPILILIYSVMLFSNSLLNNFNHRSHLFVLFSVFIFYLIGEFQNPFNKVFIFILFSYFLSYATSFIKFKFISVFTPEQLSGVFLIILTIILYCFNNPERYLVQIFLCSLFLIASNSIFENKNYKIIFSILIISILSIYFVIYFNSFYNRLKSNFDEFNCLANELIERKISTIAVDYWVAKPLYIAGNNSFNIIQFDFKKNRPFIYASPYDWANGSFNYFILRSNCSVEETTHCDKGLITSDTVYVGRLCKNYDLFYLEKPIVLDEITSKYQNYKYVFVHKFKKFLYF